MNISKATPTILFVDDEIAHMEVVMAYWPYEAESVLYANNGQTACLLAEQEQPSVIFMDWAMPLMNGIEALKRLQANSATNEIPVVMTTGVMTTSEDLKYALDAGAVDFLRKPFDKLEFQARVGAALRLSQSYHEIRQLNQREKQLLETQLAMSEQALAAKERELASLTLQSHQTNTLLGELATQVQGIEEGLDGTVQQSLRKLRKTMTDRMTVEDTWDRFMRQFEKVHPHFFKNLHAYRSGLSVNDLRLCAYLRIGMSNKEIAQLTGIAADSAKRGATRLKKKLGLGAAEDLRSFIATL